MYEEKGYEYLDNEDEEPPPLEDEEPLANEGINEDLEESVCVW